MEEPDDGAVGFRWFLRETLFVALGVALWATLGWRALLVLTALAVPVNLVWVLRGRASRAATPESPRPG